MGEYYSNTDLNDDKAMSHYLRSMKNVRPDSREYAMASFALASIFKGKGDMLRYEKYLIMACISDLRHSTRESQALQDLTMFLFRQGSSDNIDKAERYINFAMNDAKAYNNRLRILEISQKLPTIVASYREKLAAQNAVLAMATGGVTMLAVALIVLVYFIYRQNNQLTNRRHELSQSNGELQRLTTEERIFALIRLGVTESSEIAALLFYTPRTIYSYRSAVKAKAINRDTFEQDVAKLCTVI